MTASTAPVLMTAATIELMTAHCQNEKKRNREACGFIVADRGERVGSGLLPMKNVHPVDKAIRYATDDDEVIGAYAYFDANGLEPIAFFHSHLTAPALMSEGYEGSDLDKAVDTTVAYVIVSLEQSQPKARAYRVDRTFIGSPSAVEVPIQVRRADGRVPTVAYPWALVPGNDVVLTYTRTPSASGERVARVECTILTCDDETVTIKGRRTNGVKPPTSLARSRITNVAIVNESAEAARLRRAAHAHSRNLANAAASGDIEMATDLVAALHAMFPPGFTIEMGE